MRSEEEVRFKLEEARRMIEYWGRVGRADMEKVFRIIARTLEWVLGEHGNT